MLFNPTTETAEVPVEPGYTFDFNWAAEAYTMERGTPAEVNGVEAVKAWLGLVLRTTQGRYAVYPSDFGASLYALMGRKLPRGAALSELRRQLRESAAYCPTIEEIGPVTWDGERVTCSVTLSNQSTEVITVEP